jgi:putative endonuclease
MYHVYLLRSLNNIKKSYVGLTTKPIKDRLSEHNKGLSQYTKTDKPWELVYFENFYCKLCADKREQFLKSGFGYRLRKLLLENYKNLGRIELLS